MFDEGEYEIVGFFDGKVTRSQFMDDVQYDQDEGVDRQILFVPEKAVANLPEVPLSQYNTTILLDDEETMYFMSDMEAAGLLEYQKGRYQVVFEIFSTFGRRGIGGGMDTTLKIVETPLPLDFKYTPDDSRQHRL